MTAPLRILVSIRTLTPLIAGEILYAPMWEGAGTKAMDITSKHNDGTLQGAPAPTWVMGHLGNALQFTIAGSSMLEVADDADIRLDGDFTISFWAYINSIDANYDGFIRKGSAGIVDTDAYLMYYASPFAGGTLIAPSFKRNGIESPALTIASLTTWEHWVVTYGGGTLTWYHNGVYDGQHIGIVWTLTTDTTSLQIGRGDQYSNVIIDEYKTFDRALSSTEAFEEFYRSARGSY